MFLKPLGVLSSISLLIPMGFDCVFDMVFITFVFKIPLQLNLRLLLNVVLDERSRMYYHIKKAFLKIICVCFLFMVKLGRAFHMKPACSFWLLTANPLFRENVMFLLIPLFLSPSRGLLV